jgi:hypothetical protein
MPIRIRAEKTILFRRLTPSKSASDIWPYGGLSQYPIGLDPTIMNQINGTQIALERYGLFLKSLIRAYRINKMHNKNAISGGIISHFACLSMNFKD